MNQPGGSGEHLELPSGTITFLFSDIEGSTDLWERRPDFMRPALARHDLLMRAAIEGHDGVVFKTVGDSFCAAFATAPQALNAALQAQRDFLQEEWGKSGLIRVRMGLHTGTAERRDNDYFGSALNRVSRLQGIGHGQQTLLSQATYELIKDLLPPGVTLLDLGLHRLKDLAAPEHVWQVLDPSLPQQFPVLKSLDHLPTNLPLNLTSFIGRDKEMAEIRELLSKARLLTLTGSGGAGKTRLSYQVAAEVLDQYVDGIWSVELAPISDPNLVAQTVADVFAVREVPGEPILKTLVYWLKGKQMLLVLDNCEHVLEAAARLADAVLRECPNVKVLASSREALGITGESAYRVPSLSVPGAKQTHTPQSISSYESVRLFVERAVAAKSDFEVTPGNASAVASVCRRLDGIPLAVELAAARVMAMPIEQIETRLDGRFRLLTGGSRTALPRHQTLRALIDWSYDLLNEQEKSLLRCLSVFQGGWQLESAESVARCDAIEQWEVLDLLTSLVGKCLVVYEESDGVGRYRLLETVRQYARDRLAESGRHEEIRTSHRDYFLAMADEAERKLRGPEQAQWFRKLDEEHENLRAALDWCLWGPGSKEGLRFCESLWCLWETRGLLSEGREWCTRFLEKDGAGERSAERGNALDTAGWLATLQSDHAAARAYNEESLAIFKEIGDRLGISNSLNHLGNVARYQGDYAAARAYYEESVAYQREIGELSNVAIRLDNLGIVAIGQGDYAAARVYLEESLAICRDLGDRFNAAYSLDNLGSMARHLGDYESAQAYHAESLAIRREFGDRLNTAHTLCNLGLLAILEGRYPAGRSYLEDSLIIFKEIGDRGGLAAVMEAFAGLAVAEGNALRGAELWGVAEALREEIGSPLPPSAQEEYARRVGVAQEVLGEEAFLGAWARGRSMTLREAIALALEA